MDSIYQRRRYVSLILCKYGFNNEYRLEDIGFLLFSHRSRCQECRLCRIRHHPISIALNKSVAASSVRHLQIVMFICCQLLMRMSCRHTIPSTAGRSRPGNCGSSRCCRGRRLDEQLGLLLQQTALCLGQPAVDGRARNAQLVWIAPGYIAAVRDSRGQTRGVRLHRWWRMVTWHQLDVVVVVVAATANQRNGGRVIDAVASRRRRLNVGIVFGKDERVAQSLLIVCTACVRWGWEVFGLGGVVFFLAFGEEGRNGIDMQTTVFIKNNICVLLHYLHLFI